MFKFRSLTTPLSQGELNTKRVRDEEDMVVLITELRASVSGQPPGMSAHPIGFHGSGRVFYFNP